MPHREMHLADLLSQSYPSTRTRTHKIFCKRETVCVSIEPHGNAHAQFCDVTGSQSDC
jgi:hypothetical protein